jgi:hypothetical protein
LRVVLVGDGRTEQRHDPVARVLIDRAFEAMDALVQQGEEAIHHVMPRLWILSLL